MTCHSAPDWHMNTFIETITKTFIDAITKSFIDASTSDLVTIGTHVTAGLPAWRRRSPLRLTKP